MTEQKGCYWCKHREGYECVISKIPRRLPCGAIEELKELQYEHDVEPFYVGCVCKEFKQNFVSTEKVIFT